MDDTATPRVFHRWAMNGWPGCNHRSIYKSFFCKHQNSPLKPGSLHPSGRRRRVNSRGWAVRGCAVFRSIKRQICAAPLWSTAPHFWVNERPSVSAGLCLESDRLCQAGHKFQNTLCSIQMNPVELFCSLTQLKSLNISGKEAKCRLVPLDDSILSINTTKGLLRVWQEMNATTQASRMTDSATAYRKDTSHQVNHRYSAAHTESHTAAALLVEPPFDLRDADLYLRWCFEASVLFCMNKQRSLKEAGFITARFRHVWTCDAPVCKCSNDIANLHTAHTVIRSWNQYPTHCFLEINIYKISNEIVRLFLLHLLGEKCTFLSIKSHWAAFNFKLDCFPKSANSSQSYSSWCARLAHR